MLSVTVIWQWTPDVEWNIHEVLSRDLASSTTAPLDDIHQLQVWRANDGNGDIQCLWLGWFCFLAQVCVFLSAAQSFLFDFAEVTDTGGCLRKAHKEVLYCQPSSNCKGCSRWGSNQLPVIPFYKNKQLDNITVIEPLLNAGHGESLERCRNNEELWPQTDYVPPSVFCSAGNSTASEPAQRPCPQKHSARAGFVLERNGVWQKLGAMHCMTDLTSTNEGRLLRSYSPNWDVLYLLWEMKYRRLGKLQNILWLEEAKRDE